MELTQSEIYLNELFEKYVPSTGMADTLGGEIVRAMERLLYRNWNDGDHVGVGYGNETCNGSYRFLSERIPFFPSLWGIFDDKEYGGLLEKAADMVANTLKNNPAYFEIPNKIDSRETLPEDLAYEDEEWDDEEDW